jgi:hypothetical protein
MAREIDKLEGFDLSKVSVADLASMKNNVLKQALIAALESSVVEAAAEHTNHWAFTSHGKALLLSDAVLPSLPSRTNKA